MNLNYIEKEIERKIEKEIENKLWNDKNENDKK